MTCLRRKRAVSNRNLLLFQLDQWALKSHREHVSFRDRKGFSKDEVACGVGRSNGEYNGEYALEICMQRAMRQRGLA